MQGNQNRGGWAFAGPDDAQAYGFDEPLDLGAREKAFFDPLVRTWLTVRHGLSGGCHS